MLFTCDFCGSSFSRTPSQAQRTKSSYCSRKCYSEHRSKKAALNPSKCSICNNPIKGRGSSFCPSCWADNRSECISHCRLKSSPDLTLGDLVCTGIHRSSAFAKVRSRARTVAKNLGWSACQSCGYSKHIEICHIKPISDFSEDTLVSVINSPDNLKALCPNCHWEFDNLS